jgi:t-SNARE complex subunit (syntaxin)
MSFQDIGRKRNTNTPLSSSIPSASASAPSPYRTNHRQPNQNQNNNQNQSPTSKFRKGGTSSGYTYTGGINIGGGANIGANNGMSPLIEGGGGGGGDNEYSGISQAILQYQQNVGILSNIVQSIGTTRTPQDTQVLTQQYNLQTDVIQQLSSKIQLQLEQMEKQKQTNTNTNTNSTNTNKNTSPSNQQQHRATHLKLTRDYRWVETKYKNLQLEARKKWNMLEMQRRRVVEEEQRKNLENDLDHDSEQLQMQLRDDRIVEEIMREREEEVRNINKGMHQVNEIYKDLADLVSFQQDQVDEVEITMEQANKNAESGLKQIEKAHAKSNESNCVIS